MKLWKAVKMLALYAHGFGEDSGLEPYELNQIRNFYNNLDPNNPDAELTDNQKILIKKLYQKYINWT